MLLTSSFASLRKDHHICFEFVVVVDLDMSSFELCI